MYTSHHLDRKTKQHNIFFTTHEFGILDGRIRKGSRLLDSIDSDINVRPCRFCSASSKNPQQVEYRFVLACIVESVVENRTAFGVDLLSMPSTTFRSHFRFSCMRAT
jgi:hypothetical protein